MPLEITLEQQRKFKEYTNNAFYYYPIHYLMNLEAISSVVKIMEQKGHISDELREKIKLHLYAGNNEIIWTYIIKTIDENEV